MLFAFVFRLRGRRDYTTSGFSEVNCSKYHIGFDRIEEISFVYINIFVPNSKCQLSFLPAAKFTRRTVNIIGKAVILDEDLQKSSFMKVINQPYVLYRVQQREDSTLLKKLPFTSPVSLIG